MAAVAAGRKDEWLALFTPDAVVEDPVGPSRLDPAGQGHRGHDGIGRFWDRNFGADDRPQKPSPPPGHQGLGGSLIGLLIGEDAGPADGLPTLPGADECGDHRLDGDQVHQLPVDDLLQGQKP